MITDYILIQRNEVLDGGYYFDNIVFLSWHKNTKYNNLGEIGKNTSLGGTHTNGVLLLNGNISDYRFIEITIIQSGSTLILASEMYPVSLFKTYNSSSKRVLLGRYYDKWYEADIFYVDDNKVDVSNLENCGVFFDGVK